MRSDPPPPPPFILQTLRHRERSLDSKSLKANLTQNARLDTSMSMHTFIASSYRCVVVQTEWPIYLSHTATTNIKRGGMCGCVVCAGVCGGCGGESSCPPPFTFQPPSFCLELCPCLLESARRTHSKTALFPANPKHPTQTRQVR